MTRPRRVKQEARPAAGRALFYTRDSEGRSDSSTTTFVEWAVREAGRLGLAFDGTPEAARAMAAEDRPVHGDLFIDFGVSGNRMSRPALDQFLALAVRDRNVSHVLIPRRDRFARPKAPAEATEMELRLRKAGLTIVFMGGPGLLLPMGPNESSGVGESVMAEIEYSFSGDFRRQHALKMIDAKVQLARAGFSIGGPPP